MRSIEKLAALLETRINGLSLPENPSKLYLPFRYAMEKGGKRLRPLLLLVCNEMLEGDTEEALPAAIATELFHNFTLLHDDIMDNAAVRRGRPSVSAAYGENTAILAGDTIVMYAYKYLEQSPRIAELLPVFNDMAIAVCEGQQEDMDFEERESVGREEYLGMIGKKTAALIAGSMTMGAVAAEADEGTVGQIHSIGYDLGIAFQLQDDLLDSYGSEKTLGKRIGGDIREGKKSFLAVRFEEKAEEEDKKLFRKLIKRNDEDKVEKVKALFDKYDIAGDCRSEIEGYLESAMATLNTIQIADGRKKVLREVAARLTGRER